MEATGGMVAGSYNRNELVRIRHDSTDSGVSELAFDRESLSLDFDFDFDLYFAGI